MRRDGSQSETAADDASRDSETPPVFQSDASISGEQMARLLRARGYRVVDVALSMLVGRAAAQRPSAVLLDADAEDALDVARRLRELPGGESIPILAFGDVREITADTKALQDLCMFFTRPIDVERAAMVLETLVPAKAEDSSESASSRPPTALGARDAPAGMPPSRSSRIVSELSAEAPRSFGGAVLSEELSTILAAAEERIARSVSPSSNPLPSDGTSAAELPNDVLDGLTELLADAEGDGSEGRSIWRSPVSIAARTGVDEGPVHTDERPLDRIDDHGEEDSSEEEVLTPPPSSVQDRAKPLAPAEAEPATPRLPGQRGEGKGPESLRPQRLLPPIESTRPEIPAIRLPDDPPDSQLLPLQVALPRDILPTLAPPRLHVTAPTMPPRPARSAAADAIGAPTPPQAPAVLLETDAVRLLGRAVTSRHSGCLCFDGEGGLRRIVLRDGDLVAVGSSVEGESLVAYLTDRGELPKDVGKRLVGRVPPFGRLAGAALIAAGHLVQDRLWEVLRAHAEWVVGRILLLSRATCGYEQEAPGRLKSEPGMFGGSTGAEVFVEILRRVLDPDRAVLLLGGGRARLAEGASPKLLTECALAHNEEDTVARAGGATVSELQSSVENLDFVAALFALVCLGVLEIVPAAGREEEVAVRGPDPLDEEALRTRVRARLELVEESDYFTLLGVTQGATGYEIKRAYLALRRSFDPAKVVTPKTIDLVGSLQLIAEIIDEAYDILREPTRRDRYLRAISARPSPP